MTTSPESDKKAQGAYYTPPSIVERMLMVTLDPLLERLTAGLTNEAKIVRIKSLRVLDPACGNGRFLVAAAQRIANHLHALGVNLDDAFCYATNCMHGFDIDEKAVDATRLALSALVPTPCSCSPEHSNISHCNALALSKKTAQQVGDFDLVIGNPPFLNQARKATKTDGVTELAAEYGKSTDTAALFLALAGWLARPDSGVISLILPQGLINSKQFATVEQDLLDRFAVTGFWAANSLVFDDASVYVCAPVLEAEAKGWMSIWTGPSFESQQDAQRGQKMGRYLAAAKGVPIDIEPNFGERTLGDVAECANPFRTVFYGLAGAVEDEGMGWRPRLATAGSIDPAHFSWGTEPMRFNKRKFDYPRVHLDRIDDKATHDWCTKSLQPKVVVACLGQLMEPYIDFKGDIVPSTAVRTVTPTGDVSLREIGALLISPVVSWWAYREFAGLGLGQDTLSISPDGLRAIPLPPDTEDAVVAWYTAGYYFGVASREAPRVESIEYLVRSAAEMCRAYGVDFAEDSPLRTWWTGKLQKYTRKVKESDNSER